MSDVAEDPHVVAREALVRVGGVTMQNVVARLSRTPGGINGVGPRLDEHRDEIMAELAERANTARRDEPSGEDGRPGTGQGVCTPR
jgi:crotonobetainyl-CoA:carnitine CoA-transferase CaiB-like acyl-CoA transferase